MLTFGRKSIPQYRTVLRGPKRAAAGAVGVHLPLIASVRSQAERSRPLSSPALSDRYQSLQRRVGQDRRRLTQIATVAEAFGLATEALRRVHGLEYYDVQLRGGLALAAGSIADIQTGEGKTVTTALPAVLHALTGGGVHVATTNAYLSQRDFEQLAPVYRALGLTVGVLLPQSPPAAKTAAYACDITYGPGYEFGFDFLRDQLQLRKRQYEPLGQAFLLAMQGIHSARVSLAQRGHNFAIVDEADSVLIDEATTPLILSGDPSDQGTHPDLIRYAHDLAGKLVAAEDFETDEARRTIELSQSGWQKSYAAFACRPKGRLARKWSQLVEHALRAEYLLQRDVDYVVADSKVQIVDPHTGRIHDERTWSAGLHQAVETKEQVALTPENNANARITRQRFQRLYSGLCGLTGTGVDAAGEFHEFYGLPVVRIPTHRPCKREQLQLRCFRDCQFKLKAIVQDAAAQARVGRPVLIGTHTIRESRHLSNLLQQSALQHTVLNGLQDEEEAALIARAGQAGTITVATNMAGRGTDIRLSIQAQQAGGLHVIASEFHSSARVDRQLAGRAARQGDPGSCQPFASADDDLVVRHAPSLAAQMAANATTQGECVRDFGNEIRAAQRRAEQDSLQVRRQMVEHDQWLETVQSSLARRT